MKLWFDSIKNRLLLTLITYVFYMLLYLLTDETMRAFYMDKHPLWVYILDISVTLFGCFLFVQLSVFYSRFIFRRFMSFDKPYRNLLVYAVLLFIMNNLTAYFLSLFTGMLFDVENLSFLQLQHLYVYSILTTFISGIYTNAYYLSSYMEAETEKKRLEMVAMQAQLGALKRQIDPHFMFNNFSILSELIVEDSLLAGKFLDKLSKVYRYVIQNFDKNLIAVREELSFLESYLYLMEIRYEGAVIVEIAPQLREIEGNIPPVSLQLLVENALKHNRFSEKSPLKIEILPENGCIAVKNTFQPLVVGSESTGIGQRNIRERYALLSDKEPQIRCEGGVYSVYLPVI